MLYEPAHRLRTSAARADRPLDHDVTHDLGALHLGHLSLSPSFPSIRIGLEAKQICTSMLGFPDWKPKSWDNQRPKLPGPRPLCCGSLSRLRFRPESLFRSVTLAPGTSRQYRHGRRPAVAFPSSTLANGPRAIGASSPEPARYAGAAAALLAVAIRLDSKRRRHRSIPPRVAAPACAAASRRLQRRTCLSVSMT